MIRLLQIALPTEANPQKLNLLALGEIHLYKTLLKLKMVSTAPTFPSWIAKKVKKAPSDQGTANANVSARLFNSNPVRTALETILGGVYSMLDLPADNVPRRKKRLRAADYKAKPQVEGSEKQNQDQTVKSQDQGHNPERKLHKQILLKPESIDPDYAGSEDESEEDDVYNARLANSSDSESEFDEVVLSDYDIQGGTHGVSVENGLLNKHPRSNSLALSASPTPSISLSPSTSSPTSDTAIPEKSTRSTTFLPTLNGGYWSGSEGSDAGEIYEDSPSAGKQRKNRRGQQERRAIWEKKFGARARHIQNQEKDVAGSARDKGWDSKRGATEGNSRGERGGRIGMIGGGRNKGGVVRRGANSDPVNEFKKRGINVKSNLRGKAEAPLHPSWEAKKKAKERAGNNVVAFQGKKVVFE